jgi:recombination protein RecA
MKGGIMTYEKCRIKTGSPSLDRALGDGWSRGGVIDIQGGPGTGKTTIAHHATYGLETDEEALWISVGTEVPHRPFRGVLALPRSAEEVFQVIVAAIYAGARLIVVDSINGLVRQRELDGDTSYTPHPQREYKDELRYVKALCNQSLATVIFTSMPRANQPHPIRGTGLSEKATQRVHLTVKAARQDGTKTIRAEVKGTGKYATFDIKPGSGIDWASDLLKTAAELDLVQVNGSWYTLGISIQGFDTAAQYLRDHPELALDLYDKVLTTKEIN